MRLVLVHLSDIHLKNGVNVLTSRLDRLVAAVRGCGVSQNDACVVALTGDIAFSGQESEYRIALDALESLQKKLAKEFASRPEIVAVPGNHDCDFERSSQARATLLSSLTPATTLEDRSVIDLCSSVQDAFFQFHATLRGSAPLEGLDRLFWRHTLTFDSFTFSLDCYNSAWLSTKTEAPNKFIPINVFSPAPQADLSIALLHHPLSWFQPDAALGLRSQLDQTSDLVLTGHEHRGEVWERRTITAGTTQYSEGAVLQSDDPAASGFHIHTIDPASYSRKVTTFEWDSRQELYVRATESILTDQRFGAKRNDRFTPTAAFTKRLADIGTAFSHPRRDRVSRGDIFVDPAFEALSTIGRRNVDSLASSSLDTLLASNSLLIVGSEKSGKTCLTKEIVCRYLAQGIVPVLLAGDDLRNYRPGDLATPIERCFREQYPASQLERFRQAPKLEKAIVIDDFDQNRLAPETLARLIEDLFEAFGKIVVVVGELFLTQEVTRRSPDMTLFTEFTAWRTVEFGLVKRAQLVEKWCRLGREHEQDLNLERQIRTAEKIVTDLRGKSLFPSFPIFILTILQALELKMDLGAVSGAYGHLYELLINARLSFIEAPAKRQAIYAILEKLAFYLFQTHSQFIDTARMQTAVEEYVRVYRIQIEVGEVITVLCSALIFRHEAGVYSFRYPYIYYYFVAKHLQRNLATAEHAAATRNTLAEIARTPYITENANILIFFLYLTEDRATIDLMLDHARSMYGAQTPCEFGDDVAFLETTPLQPPRLELPPSTPAENRRALQRRLDLGESSGGKESSDIDDVMRLNEADKVLQILGQVLRNFAGTLPGDLKKEIASECYTLGLRTLGFVFEVLKSNLNDVHSLVGVVIREARPELTESEARDLVDGFLFFLCQGFSLGFLRKISAAVGSEELEFTYRDALDSFENPNVGLRLIDSCIRLDHFEELNVDHYRKLNSSLSKKFLAASLLRRLVRDHLLLFEVTVPVRQSLCAEFGLKENNPLFLAPATKRRGRRPK